MLDKKTIQTLRETYLAPSLSLSYGKPLHIVKGEAQYLYDADMGAQGKGQHVADAYLRARLVHWAAVDAHAPTGAELAR